MSRFAVLALCVMACLIQTAFSQVGCGCNQFSYSPALSGISLGAPSYGSASCGSYGGTGTGEVAVSGNIGASGNTVVVGSVPVLGSVNFGGCVPASGAVSISGQCGCGCGVN